VLDDFRDPQISVGANHHGLRALPLAGERLLDQRNVLRRRFAGSERSDQGKSNRGGTEAQNLHVVSISVVRVSAGA
jgi:hypothetical protein